MNCSLTKNNLKELENLSSLKEILDDYKLRKNDFWRKVMSFYTGLSDIDEAIKHASKFHKDQTHCDEHQRRILKDSKRKFATLLKKLKAQILTCANFKDLYDLLKKKCKPAGIGDLAIYDTAMRLGAYLEKSTGKDFTPQEVYLHNGTAAGATSLKKMNKISYSSNPVPLSVFSNLFKGLKPFEIEEVLCVYKNVLAKLANE